MFFTQVKMSKIRFSTPIMARARCKYCAGKPSIYYYIMNTAMWLSPNDFFRLKWVKALAHTPTKDGHLRVSPKNFYKNISYLSHNMMHTKYRPKLHRTRGAESNLDFIEILTCDCMQTVWAFADIAVQKRPEIYQRKARLKFPRK